jgi:hypothetical protein
VYEAMPRPSTVVLASVALLIFATSFTRGYGIFALFVVFLDSYRRLSSLIMIVPHLINRFTFNAIGIFVQFIVSSLNFAVSLWESSFDSFMKFFNQKPSHSSGSIVSIFSLPLHASGISSLVSIVCNQFMRVPQALEDFNARYSLVPNALIAGAIAVFFYLELRRNVRSRDSFFENFFSCTVAVMFYVDAAVFLVLVISTLIPLICIFIALAAAAYAVNYLRPSLRPKHVAPCIALIAAQ